MDEQHLTTMESSQHGMIRLNELEQQFAHFSETAIENNISFLQLLQCIEPNHILQIQALEPENSLTLETTKPDPVQTNNPETITGAVPLIKESTVVVKERKKRKRTRTPKDKDKVENQRMTHIAVERNRRRQMNEHLNSLKSLMPSSYLQRGDQASIVGGAIDFIKELEQLLLSLEGEKRHEVCNENTKTVSSSSSSSFACTTSSVSSISTASEDGFTARSGSGETAEVEATVIRNHVNLKVRCRRRQGQILKAIVAIEDMKLTVLHLTISSSFHFGFYSFNLKIEDGCKVRTPDEIATNVHLIFNQINCDFI